MVPAQRALGTATAETKPFGRATVLETTTDSMIEPFITRFAACTQRVAALPGIPTPDWCDRAADAVLALGGGIEAVLLLLADVRPDGRIREVVAAGVAVADQTLMARRRELEVRSRVQMLRAHLWVPGLHPDRAALNISGGVERGWLDDATHMAAAHAGVWSPRADQVSLYARCPFTCQSEERSVLCYAIKQRRPGSPTVHEAALMAQALLLVAKAAERAIGPDLDVPWLTEREQAVLGLLVQGKSVREVADEMGRSHHTVHDYVKDLHRKLRASTRGESVAKALGHHPPSTNSDAPPEQSPARPGHAPIADANAPSTSVLPEGGLGRGTLPAAFIAQPSTP